MQAYIFEWIGVTAHEQTQDGRLWYSPLQRLARLPAPHTHSGETQPHTTPTDPLPHLHCLKIYLPAAASRRERWALLVL